MEIEIKSLVGEVVEGLNLLDQMPKIISEGISRLDKEQQDVLHAIEFSSFNASEGYKLAKRIQDIRIERRLYKNMEEEIGRVTSVLNRHKQFKNELNNSIKSISSVNRKQGNRKYAARVIDKSDDLAQLRAVNKTGIKFKQDPHMNRLNSLFEQVKEDGCKAIV